MYTVKLGYHVAYQNNKESSRLLQDIGRYFEEKNGNLMCLQGYGYLSANYVTMHNLITVSYTHLTLPTKRIV